MSVQQEKFRVAEKGGQRTIGENKPKLSEKEKEQRRKLDAYIKKMELMDAEAKKNGQSGFMEMLETKMKEQQAAAKA
jgi:hypothetical protein